mmetsp:Transcript_17292/g.47633  ORF Transcript_17292/g.47633 Transcript_17292/m.47633 type:complete len:248 (-) Transcript_17292:593-1336(-)
MRGVRIAIPVPLPQVQGELEEFGGGIEVVLLDLQNPELVQCLGDAIPGVRISALVLLVNGAGLGQRPLRLVEFSLVPEHAAQFQKRFGAGFLQDRLRSVPRSIEYRYGKLKGLLCVEKGIECHCRICPRFDRQHSGRQSIVVASEIGQSNVGNDRLDVIEHRKRLLPGIRLVCPKSPHCFHGVKAYTGIPLVVPLGLRLPQSLCQESVHASLSFFYDQHGIRLENIPYRIGILVDGCRKGRLRRPGD